MGVTDKTAPSKHDGKEATKWAQCLAEYMKKHRERVLFDLGNYFPRMRKVISSSETRGKEVHWQEKKKNRLPLGSTGKRKQIIGRTEAKRLGQPSNPRSSRSGQHTTGTANGKVTFHREAKQRGGESRLTSAN